MSATGAGTCATTDQGRANEKTTIRLRRADATVGRCAGAVPSGLISQGLQLSGDCCVLLSRFAAPVHMTFRHSAWTARGRLSGAPRVIRSLGEILGALIASFQTMACDRSASTSPRRVRATCRVLAIAIASLCSVGPEASVPSHRKPRDLGQALRLCQSWRSYATLGPARARSGQDDFEVLENGGARPIVDFRAVGHTPISLALLFDLSGSIARPTPTGAKQSSRRS